MDLRIDNNRQKYLLFDLGHDSIKAGLFSKNIDSNYEYIVLPSELFPIMVDEL